MFEGALRKWVAPGLSMPLLVVRDPLALWLVLLTWQHGLLPKNIFLSSMVFIASLGIFATILLGHGNLAVAIYGARILKETYCRTISLIGQTETSGFVQTLISISPVGRSMYRVIFGKCLF